MKIRPCASYDTGASFTCVAVCEVEFCAAGDGCVDGACCLVAVEDVPVAGGATASLLFALPEIPSGSGSSGEPMRAIPAPMGADLPSETSILRSTPLAKDSISILTLSVSTSASDSPFFTASPSCLIQRRILPSSIVSPILGISTVFIVLFFLYANPGLCAYQGCWYNRFSCFYNRIFIWYGEAFQWLRVGHGHIRSGHVLDRGIEIVEGELVDQRGQSLACAVVFPAFLGDNDAVGFLYRVDQQVDIDRPDAAQVDDFRVDVLFSQVFGGLQRHMQHARKGEECHVPALAFHLSAIERDHVFDAFIWHFTFYIVEQFMFDKKHRVGVAHGRFEHAFDVVWCGRGDYFQAGDMRVHGF